MIAENKLVAMISGLNFALGYFEGVFKQLDLIAPTDKTPKAFAEMHAAIDALEDEYLGRNMQVKVREEINDSAAEFVAKEILGSVHTCVK